MTALPRNARASNLPLSRTPLVGRSEEANAARQILLRSAASILTLTGPPGIGKTRLALHVAAEIEEHFADGVCFVQLAPLGDPDLVPAAIASALGLTDSSHQAPIETLKIHLRSRNMLLLLDNFEHLLSATPLVADLVASCPSLQVLATSRTPLRISGELELSLSPLQLPDLQPLAPLDQLARFESVVLFVQRASAAGSGFALTQENAADVAEICVQLDGLPLAIELAAARTRLLSPAWLRARVSNRLLLLTDGPRDRPPRLQSMRDAVAWSYDLLSEPERALFRRLSVFAGGFTLNEAEALAGLPNPETLADAEIIDVASTSPAETAPLDVGVLDPLAALVDNSLIERRRRADGHVRFSMLETIREFAAEKLAESGEGATYRDLHALLFLQLVEDAEANQTSSAKDTWLDRLVDEQANLRRALEWFAQHDDPRALHVAAALAWFWLARGRHTEGRDRLGPLVERFAHHPGVPAAIWGKACAGMAALSAARDDYPASESWHQQALSWFSQIGDQSGIARSNLGIAEASFVRGDWDLSNRLAEESLARFRQARDVEGEAEALEFLGTLAQEKDDYERSSAYFREALDITESLGNQELSANLLTLLGICAQFQGHHARATELVEQSLAIARSRGDAHRIAERLGRLASIALDAGNPVLALNLAREGESLFESSPWDISPWARVVVLHNLGVALRRTGKPEQAWQVHESALDDLRSLGSPSSWTASVRVELAVDLRDLGNIDRAFSLGVEGLDLAWQSGDCRGVAVALEEFAATAIHRDFAAVAVRFIATAARLRTRIGAPRPPGSQPAVEQTLIHCRKVLRDRAFREAMAEAKEIPAEAAIAEALEISARIADGQHGSGSESTHLPPLAASALTPREQQVLRLLVEGRSNPEIAATLSISRKTSRSHVSSILAKLGVESRTAAATLALRNGLV